MIADAQTQRLPNPRYSELTPSDLTIIIAPSTIPTFELAALVLETYVRIESAG